MARRSRKRVAVRLRWPMGTQKLQRFTSARGRQKQGGAQGSKAVKKAVKQHVSSKVGSIEFVWKSGMLFIILPSGRRLSYVKPKMSLSQYGTESVTYYGTVSQKKWGRIESYGPKFVENIVQAISRDLLCYAMTNLHDHRIVGHVHDELIIECPENEDYHAICSIMGQTPPWLPWIYLRADGYCCTCYQKDT